MDQSTPVHPAYLPVTVMLFGEYTIGLFFFFPPVDRLGYEIREQLRLMSIPINFFFSFRFRLLSAYLSISLFDSDALSLFHILGTP